MRSHLPAGIVLVFAAVSACGGDDGGGGSGTTSGLTTVLERIEDDDDLLKEIDYVDLAAIRKAAGLGSLDADDRDDVRDFSKATLLLGVPAPASGQLFRDFETSADIGLDPFTIDREVSVGGGPIQVAELAMDVDLGDFNDVADELASEDDGVREFELDPRNELARTLLGSSAVGAEKDRLVFGADADLVRAVVKGDGVDDSLADNADLQALLGHLGSHQRLYVTNEFVRPEGVVVPAAPARPVLGGLGIDLANDDGDEVTATAVILFDNEDDATDMAEWYQSIIDDNDSPNGGDAYDELIPDVEIETDGPAVVATWNSTTGPMNLLFRRDLPFFWAAE